MEDGNASLEENTAVHEIHDLPESLAAGSLRQEKDGRQQGANETDNAKSAGGSLHCWKDNSTWESINARKSEMQEGYYTSNDAKWHHGPRAAVVGSVRVCSDYSWNSNDRQEEKRNMRI